MNKTRLEAFSDGVFSIVMTLLIFNIKVPVLAEPFTDGALWRALAGVWPLMLIYVLTFTVLSAFWINHHVLFESFAKSIDRRLTLLNLLYLMFIVFIPFTASLWGAYSTHQPAATLYGLNIFVVVLISTVMGVYIRKTPELAHDAVSVRMVRHGQFRSWVSLTSYAIGIAITFFHPALAATFYVLPVVFNIIPASLGMMEEMLGVRFE
jgi:uncharacterized membrane protein